MEKHLKVLIKTSLFNNISQDEIGNLLKCISGTVKKYKKDEIIFLEGDKITSIGIVVSGMVQIVREDFLGNRNIISKVSEGEMFGEVFVCSELKIIPVTVFAGKDSEILFIPFSRIISTCPTNCGFHKRLIENMLRIMAEKSMNLHFKMHIMFCRTIQEKLMSYLSSESKKAGSRDFTIPYNRNELADYLGINRSAMSRELCKMRDEGILDFDKNRFILY